MDTEAFVPDEEELGRAHSFRHDQDVRVFAVERSLVPAGAVDDRVSAVSRVGKVVTEAFDRRREVLGNPVDGSGEVDRDIVAQRDGVGVTTVPVQQHDHPGDVPAVGHQLVDALGVDRIDHPHLLVDHECVAGAGHALVRKRKPPDTSLEVVDRRQVRRWR